MSTGSFPRVKCGRGMLLTTQPLLVPRSWKSRAIPLPTLWATPALYRENFAFTFYRLKTTAERLGTLVVILLDFSQSRQENSRSACHVRFVTVACVG